jgi:hypothetical protein
VPDKWEPLHSHQLRIHRRMERGSELVQEQAAQNSRHLWWASE